MSASASVYPVKKLVINLVKEAARPVSAGMLIRMGEIFGIEANNVRVTLNRLTKADLLAVSERGVYQLGSAALGLAEQQRSWRQLESSLRDWEGEWLAIYVAHLGRRDRKQLKAREQAATMLGFAGWHQGLLIRPDNLVMSIDEVDSKLHQLGMEAEASVFRINTFARGSEPDPSLLWSSEALEENYRGHIHTMRTWRVGMERKTLDEQARECFLIGDEVLRSIAYDPRLPVEMLNTQLRRDMINEMAEFDDLGKKIWNEFMDSLRTEADA